MTWPQREGRRCVLFEPLGPHTMHHLVFAFHSILQEKLRWDASRIDSNPDTPTTDWIWNPLNRRGFHSLLYPPHPRSVLVDCWSPTPGMYPIQRFNIWRFKAGLGNLWQAYQYWSANLWMLVLELGRKIQQISSIYNIYIQGVKK